MHILITGSSKGIGKEIFKFLKRKKHVVYSISRKRSKNKKIIHCDITNLNDLNAKLSNIKKLDVIINNAAISQTGLKKKEDFKKIIETNLIAPYNISEILLKKIKNSNNASIINISSINAYQAFPNNPGYVSSKAGLNSLTRALALDYGKFKVRVNSISPGYIAAGMSIKSFRNSKKKNIRSSRTILGRWGEPKDLYGLVEFLISKKSSYITGQDFVVDGGWLAKGL